MIFVFVEQRCAVLALIFAEYVVGRTRSKAERVEIDAHERVEIYTCILE